MKHERATVAAPIAGALKPQYGWSTTLYLLPTPWVGKWAIRLGLTASAVSLLSLVLFGFGLLVYIECSVEWLRRGAAVLLFCVGTLLDVLDGFVARETKTQSVAGAVLDAAIDMVRYSLYFLALIVTQDLHGLWFAVVISYAVLAQLSLIRTIMRAVRRQKKEQLANEALGRVFPKAYVEFCLRYRLLFNPLNLEDQITFLILVVGVLTGLEKEVIAFCLMARLLEVGAGLWASTSHKLKTRGTNSNGT